MRCEMKRIIKNIFAIILSLVSLVSVYACTSESNSAEKPVNPENPNEILFAYPISIYTEGCMNFTFPDTCTPAADKYVLYRFI